MDRVDGNASLTTADFRAAGGPQPTRCAEEAPDRLTAPAIACAARRHRMQIQRGNGVRDKIRQVIFRQSFRL